MSALLVVFSFLSALVSGRHSVGLGVALVIWVGALFGIIRAQLFDSISYFIFDASVAGFYLSQFDRLTTSWRQSPQVRVWTVILITWPLFYFGMGFVFPQHPLIQLVGLRAAIWYLPFIIVGTLLTRRDIILLVRALAFLNILVFIFALGEFVLGVETFYPRNAVTENIYKANDVAGYTAYRIPATFASSAGYGTYLVFSLPLIIARLASAAASPRERIVMVLALLTAMMGIFMCGSRTPVLGMTFMFVVAGVLLRHRVEILVVLLGTVAIVGYQVATEERFQRASSLTESDTIRNKVNASANFGIVDVLTEHPFGVGLGGAWGTNIPGFLMQYAPYQVGAENELARVALEQSCIGLGLWLIFVIWCVRRGIIHGSGLSLRLLTAFVSYSWATSFIGAGLLTSVPTTAILFCYMGIVGATDNMVAIPYAKPRQQSASTG